MLCTSLHSIWLASALGGKNGVDARPRLGCTLGRYAKLPPDAVPSFGGPFSQQQSVLIAPNKHGA